MMKFKLSYQRLLHLLILVWAPASFANGIFFDPSGVSVNENGQVSVTVAYDFIDIAVFSGGFNLSYDSESLEFVSYTPNPPQAVNFGGHFGAGELLEPGFYDNVIFGTKFFGGFTGTGNLGVFLFEVIGPPPSATADGCVESDFICLLPNLPFGGFISLIGEDVTTETFDNDGTGIAFSDFPQPVPIPAAIWLFLGGMGILGGLKRKL